MILPLLMLVPRPGAAQEDLTSIPAITKRLKFFTPAEITADLSVLPKNDREALTEIVRAARIAEDIYLTQIWSGNDTLRARLRKDTSAEGKIRWRYYSVNMGPWSVADRFKTFIAGAPSLKPARGSLYPEDILRREWGPWFIKLDAAGQAKATGPYFVIRRDSAGTLIPVPYSTEYAEPLRPASDALTKAAGLVSDPGTRAALLAAATAFTDDDYASAEKASILSDGPISFMIEPTDRSADNYFYYRRGFEAVVGIRNRAETDRLKTIEKQMGKIARQLGETPVPPGPGGGGVRLRVDDAIFIGGGARVGAVVTAVRLPSDSAGGRARDRRTTLLRNVHEAKFRSIHRPIADATLVPGQAGTLTFDAFFLHLMTHELSHRFDRGENDSSGGTHKGGDAGGNDGGALSEARADAAGMAGLQLLIDNGTFGKKVGESLYPTTISSLIRALRFGLVDAYARGAAIQLNYYMERQAVLQDPSSGKFSVDAARMKQAAPELFRELTSVMNDPASAKKDAFMSKYGTIPPGLSTLREKLSSIPFDLEPSFPDAR